MAAPKAEIGQLAWSGADTIEHGQRILVRVEMADPEHGRFPVKPRRRASGRDVSGGERARELGDLEDLDARRQQPRAAERLRLRARAERDACRGGGAAAP